MNAEEFVAHTSNVNCLSMGKKTCRLLITGGDDQKVNVWAIGKPTSLMSLCGHTSAVESLAFDSAEVLVLAGASTGVIKLWDLEETKMVRGLTGHRSNCTAMEFHPFGEFFASGSMDTNLKIWDIRKKGCIHTYKGHTRGISTIRFTPDGRWVVSGGFDNVVKVWDLTAGKLLHDFKFHEGHIRSIDFHPLEFLLVTGSADRTVKFWDLETFELIGSSRPEATGVRTTTFHPDGRTLFCGSDDSLKVYSWEPVICHDSIDMGWSTLGDLCINEGKLLGCSYYQNSVGVWVADIAHIEPYGRNDRNEKKFNLEKSYSPEKAGSGIRSTLGSRPLSPDYETKEIKNIYVDTASSNPIASQKTVPSSSPKMVLPLDASDITNLASEKQSPGTGVNAKSNEQLGNKSFITPSIVSQDTPPAGKDSGNSEKEIITFSRTKPGMLLRPAHVRKPSVNKFEVEKLSAAVEAGSLSNKKTGVDITMDLDSQTRKSCEEARKSCEEEDLIIKTVTPKSEKTLSPQPPPNQETSNESRSKDSNSVKFVNGVAVVPGRTRTLVERFERRERLNSSSDPETNSTGGVVPETDKTPSIVKGETQISKTESVSSNDGNSDESPISRTESTSGYEGSITSSQISRSESTPSSDGIVTGDQISRRESIITSDRIITGNQNSRKESSNTTNRVITENQISRKESTSTPDRIITGNQISRREPSSASGGIVAGTESTSDYEGSITRSQVSRSESTPFSNGIVTGDQISRRESIITSDRIITRNQNSRKESSNIPDRVITGNQISRKEPTSTPDRIITGNQISRREPSYASGGIIAGNQISRRESRSAFGGVVTRNPISRRESTSPSDGIITGNQISRRESTSVSGRTISRNLNTRREATSADDRSGPNVTITENQISRRGLNSANDGNVTIIESQTSEGESVSANEGNITESLMETHDIFLSTLRSRLTKLQVVRHFWEKNDAKGAIGALRKLPDHSVQADVISVLMEKMEILTLDLFSGLLPVLMGLLDSKMERHVNVSLEMLLKLVAVFGPMIRSTVSAPRGVGVDLHAEQRRESCNQCFMQLQRIQKILPLLVRKGGTIARCAQELILVLQE
ncbi:hypothetical protein COLO4_31545 [Corchorus olitorius]|uniref:Katanin p80 WD40 repeat-containing subunit B1 homolog n=1 Tax=Corchorus olitorius TaxID=93759 RepID=A0A1R3H414_9ROSI|nr:hypothetical protein COLO4_31545 [Corchorus olitorius]